MRRCFYRRWSTKADRGTGADNLQTSPNNILKNILTKLVLFQVLRSLSQYIKYYHVFFLIICICCIIIHYNMNHFSFRRCFCPRWSTIAATSTGADSSPTSPTPKSTRSKPPSSTWWLRCWDRNWLSSNRGLSRSGYSWVGIELMGWYRTYLWVGIEPTYGWV